MSWEPEISPQQLAEWARLFPGDLDRGYRDALNCIAERPNASPAYQHGWTCGTIDRVQGEGRPGSMAGRRWSRDATPTWVRDALDRRDDW